MTKLPAATPATTSLRGLARRLQCSHAALSKQVHSGLLTAGVRIERGRVVVTDAAAAEAQWRGIHIPRVDEMIRRKTAARAAPPAPAPADDGIFDDLTKQDLIERWVAFDTFARILVEASIEPRDEATARAFVKRITTRLRAAAAAPQYREDPEALADAERLLNELVNDTMNPEQ